MRLKYPDCGLCPRIQKECNVSKQMRLPPDRAAVLSKGRHVLRSNSTHTTRGRVMIHGEYHHEVYLISEMQGALILVHILYSYTDGGHELCMEPRRVHG